MQFGLSKLKPGKPALSPHILRQEEQEDRGLEGALSSLFVMYENHTKLTRGQQPPPAIKAQARLRSSCSAREAFAAAAWRGCSRRRSTSPAQKPGAAGGRLAACRRRAADGKRRETVLGGRNQEGLEVRAQLDVKIHPEKRRRGGRIECLEFPEVELL